MKLFKFWLPIAMAVASFTATNVSASCDCYSSDLRDEIDERDFDAVVEYLNSKRSIVLQEKACNLALSGDVRAEWQNITEKVNGISRRGGDARDCYGDTDAPVGGSTGTPDGIRIPRNDFDIAVNLYFDYKCDRTWGVAQLQFDNSMGVQESHKEISTQNIFIDANERNVDSACQRYDNETSFGSGRSDGLSLRKAYMGYNLCADGQSRLDVEVGRRRFYDVFDSRVEFNSLFDGVLLRYSSQFDCCSDAYINVAGFVVDERSSHFGWVVEAGALNIFDSGFDVKYSYIDWELKGINRAGIPHPRGWQFHIHQILGYYHLDDDLLCMPAKAYGAFLINTLGAAREQTNETKANIGWYVGGIIGEVCREGDWSLDVNYQYVQAQAVPDADVSGIGRGNAYKETFTMASAAANARGNANFKGWRAEALYALTDNLTVNAQFHYSTEVDAAIGGTLHYSKWKLSTIYAF